MSADEGGEETEVGKASRTKKERREAKEAPEVEAVRGEPIPEHLTPNVELAKQRKEAAVKAKEEGGTDDLAPWLDFYRQDRPVATVVCRNVA